MCIPGRFDMKSTIMECTLLAVIGSKQKQSPVFFSSGFQPFSAVDDSSFISSVQSFSNGVGPFNTKCLS